MQKNNFVYQDKLWLNLSNFMRKYPDYYKFIPNTYLMLYDFKKIKSMVKDP
jgi:tubulin polyglutamylase TTLL4